MAITTMRSSMKQGRRKGRKGFGVEGYFEGDCSLVPAAGAKRTEAKSDVHVYGYLRFSEQQLNKRDDSTRKGQAENNERRYSLHREKKHTHTKWNKTRE